VELLRLGAAGLPPLKTDPSSAFVVASAAAAALVYEVLAQVESL
jgi:hypothetical protein